MFHIRANGSAALTERSEAIRKYPDCFVVPPTNDDRMIVDSCTELSQKPISSSLRVFISEEQTKETDEMKAVPKDEDSPLGLIYQ